MAIRILAVWVCNCGTRVKVVAETNPERPPSTQVALCPHCGAGRLMHADTIISVTEDNCDVDSAIELN